MSSRWASSSSTLEMSPARRRAAISWAWRRVSARPGVGRAGTASGSRLAGRRSLSRRHGRPGRPARRSGGRCRSGALARASSTSNPGRTTSSRRMFSCSMTWAVGGMDSVSSSESTAYWSRMWFSCPSRRVDLLLAEPEACEVGDVLDVATGKGGHRPRIASSRASGFGACGQQPGGSRGGSSQAAAGGQQPGLGGSAGAVRPRGPARRRGSGQAPIPPCARMSRVALSTDGPSRPEHGSVPSGDDGPSAPHEG